MIPQVYEVEYYEVALTDGDSYYVLVQDAGYVHTYGELSEYVDGEVAEPNEPAKEKKGWKYELSGESDWGVADNEREAWRELWERFGQEDVDWRTDVLTNAGLCLVCENVVPDGTNEDGCCSHKCWVRQVERNGPTDGDYVTHDYKEFYEFEGDDFVVTDADHWQEDLKAVMDANMYWPNVWYQGERGDWNLLDVETGKYCSEEGT